MTKRILRGATGLGTAAILAACSAGEGTDFEEATVALGRVSQPIINGVEATDPHHAAVVSLHRRYINSTAFSPSIFCSGTLIAPNVVLTAAHCLDAASGGKNFTTNSYSVSGVSMTVSSGQGRR